METPGRIVVSPHALDFTVENVEKVSFIVFTAIPEDNGLIRFCKRMKRWSILQLRGKWDGLCHMVVIAVLFSL